MITWLALAHAAPYRTDHHHAEFRWETLETRYFRVHYPVDEGADARRTAERVARVADDLLLRLADETGWTARGPIHVVVSDEADGMQAYTLPHWRWIVLSADPGVEVFRLRGRQDWLPDALAHELGHLVGHGLGAALAPTASYGIGGTAVQDLGPVGVGAAFTLGPNEPYGWSEGAAEYWSERIGVTRWSSGRAATLRTTVLADRLLDWDEWLVSADKNDTGDAERAYQQGYAFAAWLADEFGEDVFLALAQQAHRRYPASWSRRLEQVTEEPARISWARWRAQLGADVAAETAAIRARGVVEGVELERHPGPWVATDLDARDRWLLRAPRDREQARERSGTFELYPSTSPDGRWTAQAKVGWIQVQRGAPSDWPVEGSRTAAREQRTDRTTVWVPAVFGESFSFVPGRDALVVVASEDVHRSRLRPGLRDPLNRLFVVDLTPEAQPVRHRGGTIALERLVMNRKRMTPIPGTLRGRDPAVSADGTRLAWVSYGDGTSNLVVSGLDGSDPVALSSFDDGTELQHPSWSPDGRAIVVSMLRTDRPDLWRVDVASRTWTPLTADGHDEFDPVWAADGIWFAADPDGISNIYRLDPDTGSVTQQTSVLGAAHTPWVLPDGDLLYTLTTGWGYQAMRVPAHALLGRPATDRFGAPPPTEEVTRDLAFRPAPVPFEARPYRGWRNVLVPAVAPLVRFDGGVPLGGAFLRLRDAVERSELSAFGLVGEDLAGDVRWVWRGLPPEIALWASGARDVHRDATLRSFGTAGVDVTGRVRDGVALTASGGWWATSDERGPRIRSARAGIALGIGEPPERDAPLGVGGTLAWSHAWSDGIAAGWNRVELDLAGGAPLPFWIGPLTEHRHHLEWQATAGWTDRPVSPDEQLFAGGDVPGALRLGTPVVSTPFPGFAPYAIAGDGLAVVRGTWVLPVAPRLRTGGGPLYLQALDVRIGAGAGGTASSDLRSFGPPLADVSLEVRLSALLFDAPWDSLVRFAWGLGTPDPRDPAGLVPSGITEPRVVISLGAGF